MDVQEPFLKKVLGRRRQKRTTKPKKSIFYLEARRFKSRKWNLLIVAGLFFLLLGMFQVRLSEHKDAVKEIGKANALEKDKHRLFHNYTVYSAYGFRLYCMPCPLDFLTAFKFYNELDASADVGVKLRLSEGKKGNNVFPDTAGGYLNFAGILLLFGSLAVIIFGFGAFDDESYLKFLRSLHRLRKIIFQVFLFRIGLVAAFVLLLSAAMAVTAFFNGIAVLSPHYIIFTLIALLVLLCFFSTGAALGALKNRHGAIAALVTLFIFLNFIAPWVIIKIVRNISVSISEHQREYDKLKILMTFEKNGIKIFGKVRSGEEFIKLVRSYLAKELILLKDLEHQHRKRLLEKADKYQILTMFLPSTFYLSSVQELSGKGLTDYFLFYDFAEAKKEGFIKFYFENEYFADPKPKNVVPYLKGDEGIFFQAPALPEYFFMGLALQLLYMAAMFGMAFRNARRKLHPVKQKFPAEEDLFINIHRGKPNALLTSDDLTKDKLFNHLSGAEKLKSTIEFTWGSGTEGGFEDAWNCDFVYLPHPETFNAVGPAALHTYLFGERPKENMEIGDVLLKFALQRKLMVMEGFLQGLHPEKVNDILLKIEEQDHYCLLVTDDCYFTKAIVPNEKHIHCPTAPCWGSHL
ncbi:MAG: hypothetical protein GY950_01185 [bacterium]|nr:hypothetical protein [bacterium]